MQDTDFAFTLPGSVVGLANVANINGTGMPCLQQPQQQSSSSSTDSGHVSADNTVVNNANCAYLANTPFVVTGTFDNVQCC